LRLLIIEQKAWNAFVQPRINQLIEQMRARKHFIIECVCIVVVCTVFNETELSIKLTQKQLQMLFDMTRFMVLMVCEFVCIHISFQ